MTAHAPAGTGGADKGVTMRTVFAGLGRFLDRWAMRRYQRAGQHDADRLREGDERIQMAREGRLGGRYPGA
jgi:hypothetical protein